MNNPQHTAMNGHTHSPAANNVTAPDALKTATAPTGNILPADKTQALNALIKATRNLVELAEREGQALAINDLMSFHILQEEKAFLATRYERLSAEFRARLQEFRGSDPGLLDRLEKLQQSLGEKTKSNSDVVQTIHNRAQQKTQSSLLTVQELAQQKSVNFGTKDARKNAAHKKNNKGE